MIAVCRINLNKIVKDEFVKLILKGVENKNRNCGITCNMTNILELWVYAFN